MDVDYFKEYSFICYVRSANLWGQSWHKVAGLILNGGEVNAQSSLEQATKPAVALWLPTTPGVCVFITTPNVTWMG